MLLNYLFDCIKTVCLSKYNKQNNTSTLLCVFHLNTPHTNFEIKCQRFFSILEGNALNQGNQLKTLIRYINNINDK